MDFSRFFKFIFSIFFGISKKFHTLRCPNRDFIKVSFKSPLKAYIVDFIKRFKCGLKSWISHRIFQDRFEGVNRELLKESFKDLLWFFKEMFNRSPRTWSWIFHEDFKHFFKLTKWSSKPVQIPEYFEEFFRPPQWV